MLFCYIIFTYSGLYLVYIPALISVWYYYRFSLLRTMNNTIIHFVKNVSISHLNCSPYNKNIFIYLCMFLYLAAFCSRWLLVFFLNYLTSHNGILLLPLFIHPLSYWFCFYIILLIKFILYGYVHLCWYVFWLS